MNRRLEKGEEDVTAMDRHNVIMAIVTKIWGPVEPKTRTECAFPGCKKTKKSIIYQHRKSGGGGSFCPGHSKQKQRHGPAGMAPLGLLTVHALAWADFTDAFPKAKNTPWKCAWPGCRKRSTYKNGLHCNNCRTRWYKWRKKHGEEG